MDLVPLETEGDTWHTFCIVLEMLRKCNGESLFWRDTYVREEAMGQGAACQCLQVRRGTRCGGTCATCAVRLCARFSLCSVVLTGARAQPGGSGACGVGWERLKQGVRRKRAGHAGSEGMPLGGDDTEGGGCTAARPWWGCGGHGGALAGLHGQRVAASLGADEGNQGHQSRSSQTASRPRGGGPHSCSPPATQGRAAATSAPRCHVSVAERQLIGLSRRWLAEEPHSRHGVQVPG